MFLNIRMRLGCMIAGLGIRMMPENWRTRDAVGNLILTGHINTGVETTRVEN